MQNMNATGVASSKRGAKKPLFVEMVMGKDVVTVRKVKRGYIRLKNKRLSMFKKFLKINNL